MPSALPFDLGVCLKRSKRMDGPSAAAATLAAGGPPLAPQLPPASASLNG